MDRDMLGARLAVGVRGGARHGRRAPQAEVVGTRCLATSESLGRVLARHRDLVCIFGLALGVRIVFSLLMSGTYDGDEFVYLALGRDVAHGAVPYRDFGFFHPPGILVLLGFLDPLTSLWWPFARLVDILIDCGTTLLVWRAGKHLYGPRVARFAAALYALSPIVLLSAVRVDQEVPMTALCMVGIVLLLEGRSRRAVAVAGACLAAACWIKYPMLAFLPAYLLLAKRRSPYCLAGFAAASVLLFLPYLGEIHQLVADTVGWQLFDRSQMPLDGRLKTTLIFWLVLNAFAVGALWRRRNPLWLVAAFATGAIFLATSAVYSHYFVPIEPFAALLGAPLAARLIRIQISARMAVGCILALAVVWSAAIGAPGIRHYFIASDAAKVQSVIRLIDRYTPPGSPILTNRFEYAYLAQRPWVAHYFWNDNRLISARSLERRLSSTSAVLLSSYSDWAPYPAGFVQYLNAHFPRIMRDGEAMWLVRRSVCQYVSMSVCQYVSMSRTQPSQVTGHAGRPYESRGSRLKTQD